VTRTLRKYVDFAAIAEAKVMLLVIFLILGLLLFAALASLTALCDKI
jgi:hypothetical protein